MSWLESKYISLLSGRLLKFKRKSPVLFNFRCNLCGDSEVSKTKARGYIYQRNGSFWFTCHNCGVSLPFTRFLKQIDTGLYNQYLMEVIQNKDHNQEKNTPQPNKKLDNQALNRLQSLAELLRRHPARKYVESRKIPEEFYTRLYYCDEFKAWTNEQLPDKFELTYGDEERIVIPFLDSSGKMFGYTGRSLVPEAKVRYIAIMLDESRPKLFGLDRVDLNRQFYAIEGPIDSLFLKNAVASGGGKITSELLKLGCDLDKSVIVYDNEPRNLEVVASVRKAILNNFSVVIWPSNYNHKDLNDAILAGYTQQELEVLLKKNTYKGLVAQLEFKRWART